jgi:hypothetical protein
MIHNHSGGRAGPGGGRAIEAVGARDASGIRRDRRRPASATGRLDWVPRGQAIDMLRGAGPGAPSSLAALGRARSGHRRAAAG